MRELSISAAEQNQRLDKYLKKYFNRAPGSFIYKMLRKKNIKLNRTKAEGHEILQAGDHIQLFLADDTIDGFREITGTKKTPLPSVIYEDDHILLANKPAGLLTQKAVSSDLSLVDEILYYLELSGKYDPSAGTTKPSACNRLDRNTSGLVLAGIDMAGLQFLSEILNKRTLKKVYLCIVSGIMTEKKHIRGYLLKDEKPNRVHLFAHPTPGASRTETYFTPLSHNGELTLVQAELITGKTHQIRSHLAGAGYPIVGDTKYGDEKVNRRYRQKYGVKHQLLHAQCVTFPECEGIFAHLSGRRFFAPLPEYFEHCMIGEHLHEGYDKQQSRN